MNEKQTAGEGPRIRPNRRTVMAAFLAAVGLNAAPAEAKLAEPAQEATPSLPADTLEWPGWKPADIPDVATVASAYEPWMDEYLPLYAGEQWPSEIKAARLCQKRPALTVNMLPLLWAASYGKSKAAGENPSEEAILRSQAVIAAHNADAQRFYNYMLSCAAERRAVGIQPMRLVERPE